MIAYIPPIAYSLAFLFVGLYLFSGTPILRTLLNGSIAIGLVTNVVEVAMRFISTGNVQTSTAYDFLIMLSLAFAVTYFVIYAKYQRPMIGMFLLPFPLVCSMIVVFAPPPVADVSVASSVWRFIHLPFIILGSTFFIASFISSVMFLLQERQLRLKSFGFVFKRFPPLNTIDKILAMTLRFGFYFFSVGAVAGFFWVFSSEYSFSSAMKIGVSLITWLVFAVILVLKHKNRITPRQTAFLTIVGLLTILISYVGVISFLLG